MASLQEALAAYGVGVCLMGFSLCQVTHTQGVMGRASVLQPLLGEVVDQHLSPQDRAEMQSPVGIEAQGQHWPRGVFCQLPAAPSIRPLPAGLRWQGCWASRCPVRASNCWGSPARAPPVLACGPT